MKKIISIVKDNKLLCIFSILESFLQVYGFILTNDKSLVDFNYKYFLMFLIILIIVLGINTIYFKIISLNYENNYKYNFSKKNFLLTWGFLFLMWIPVLLAYYPTIWSYDVRNEVAHLIGVKLSIFHPILHIIFIELFLFIGKKICSYEFGMLLLSIVQMLIMSAIFSYAIEKVKTWVNNKKIVLVISIVLIIYYGLLPFNSILSISMTKDVFFSGLLLLLTIFLYDLIDNKSIDGFKKIPFIVISVLLLLMKNNAAYIYTLFVFLLMLCFKNKYKQTLIKLCLISLFIYYAIILSVVYFLKPDGSSVFEQYSIPTQNLIYTVIKHPKEDVPENSKLFDIIPRNCFPKNLAEIYDKHRSDNVKNSFTYCVRDDLNSYILFKKWLYYGIKYPIDYLDSISNLNLGLWYLYDESHANTYANQGYLLTDFKSEDLIMTKRPPSKFPWLKNKLELVATKNIQYSNNIFRFIFCPATYILSFFLMIVYILKNNLKEELIPLYFLIILYLSILIGPVVVVRYVYPFMIIVPLLFIRLLSKSQK